MNTDERRKLALRLHHQTLDAMDPGRAALKHWPADLGDSGRVFVLAVGKASPSMARAACEQLGSPEGLLIGPESLLVAANLPATLRRIPADHPTPTERNLDASDAAAHALSRLGEGDTLLLLLSGGGSAYLASPAKGVALADLAITTERLLRSGATIVELNTVRKHIERLKGGRLASIAHPARVIAMVVCDVIGDRLDTVSSGPAYPDPTTFAEALDIVQTRLGDACPASVLDHLERGAAGELPETPKPGDPVFDRVSHTIIASNRRAVEAATDAARNAGLGVHAIKEPLSGEASEAAAAFVRRAAELASKRTEPVALIAGGETTVTVGERGGKGGRNQEFALACAAAMPKGARVTIASLGTDGIDGPTDAAGAVVDETTIERAVNAGFDPAATLERHDSYPLLDAIGDLVRTGPSGNNINDLVIAIALPPEQTQ
ncbi:MAG: DUF4147 domain-containing protein [Phycisphaerales bacterium]|nr:DUF4147 domain-containing protein [Phycisphaerales bacterium]